MITVFCLKIQALEKWCVSTVAHGILICCLFITSTYDDPFFSGLLCFLAVLLIIGTTYDILVLQLKLVCQNPSKSIIPLRYINTGMNDGENEKDTYTTATEQIANEVESSFERKDETDTKEYTNLENSGEMHSGRLKHTGRLN